MRDDAGFGWHRFAICVFDEVHHVLKDHPYRLLAHALGTAATKTQVLGLSASLTYAIGEAAVKRSLQELSRDLGLDGMISVGDAELLAGGYRPPHDEVEIAHPRVVPEGVVPEEERRPHEPHATFFGRVRARDATAFALALHSVVRGLEERAATLAPAHFRHQLAITKLSAWETHAHKLAQQLPQHAEFFGHLETWFVALRVLVTTWEEEEELVLHWLCCRGSSPSDIAGVLGTEQMALNTLRDRLENPANLSKVACLKAQLLEKKALFGEDFRAIVFVQQRITAHVLAAWIMADPELTGEGLCADYVAARKAQITPSLVVSQGQANDCVSRFREGELNVLVATAVIEEGFDVPAANVVISFDPLKDSVELAQRFGRARREERRIVAMDQRRDRPIARLEQVRREQDVLIANFDPNQAVRNLDAERVVQKAREAGARQLLLTAGENPVATLNLYVKKTKAYTTEASYQHSTGWTYVLTYETSLRNERAEGCALNKKVAKKMCASNLLGLLRAAGITTS